MKVQFTDQARKEIREARDWIKEHAPEAANRWIDGLMIQIGRLSSVGRLMPKAPESPLDGVEVRQCLYGNKRHAYRIIFSIEKSLVRILHVRHASRDYLRPHDAEGD